MYKLPKVKSFSKVVGIAKIHKNKGQIIGLITGCFDILHPGHIDLFKFSKKNIEILIVGVDNDRSIKPSKGNNRPFHPLKDRLKVLNSIEEIDYLFPIAQSYHFSSTEVQAIHRSIYQLLIPSAVITNKYADKYWRAKFELFNNS